TWLLHSAVNAEDLGNRSIRHCVADANFLPGANSIPFDAAFFSTPKTITLTSGEMAVTDALTITGPGSALATVSGNNNSRIFNLLTVPQAALVDIEALSLVNGRGTNLNGAGGAI